MTAFQNENDQNATAISVNETESCSNTGLKKSTKTKVFTMGDTMKLIPRFSTHRIRF